MSLARSEETIAALEAEWPNHREVLGVWLPKSKVMVYNARDESQLSTLLSRIPKEWSEANVVPFREWFDLSDHQKEQYVGKHLILTRYVQFNEITHIPGYLFFLPYSVIMFENNQFSELRDQSGCKWGDFERRISTPSILNGKAVL